MTKGKTICTHALFIFFTLLSSCGSKIQGARTYVYVEPKPLYLARNVICTQKKYIKRCEFDIDMAAHDIIQIYTNDMEKNGWANMNGPNGELWMAFNRSDEAYGMDMTIESMDSGDSHVIYTIKYYPGM